MGVLREVLGLSFSRDWQWEHGWPEGRDRYKESRQHWVGRGLDMERGVPRGRLTGWADQQPLHDTGSDPLLSLGPLHLVLRPEFISSGRTFVHKQVEAQPSLREDT